ncbi:HlyC/CorC family transporter [Thiorhodovibrio winogradskyi]|nr:transporter associated domain-containing protein [Thiorhodovibrio winogradskyi]
MTSDRPRSGEPLKDWRKRLCQLLGGEPRDKNQLLDILRDAERRALLDRDGLSMIEGVLQVADLRAEDIMIPRAEMVTVRRDSSLEEILAIAVESSHSRFPVTGEDKGEVLGILLAKDLLAYCTKSNTRPFNIRDHLRSAIFVPESKRLNVLLKEFRGSRNHMAIVVDEYGAAAGLATIEDVLEQIVGEIEDEHDFDEGAFIFKRGPGEYTVKARTSIEDFNEYFASTLSGEDVDTIGGLVVHALGKLPVRGERVQIDGFRFTVLRADSRRVHLLSVRVSPAVESARAVS